MTSVAGKNILFVSSVLICILGIADSIGRNGNAGSDIFNIVADSSLGLFDSGPPPHEEAARMARYITHRSSKRQKIHIKNEIDELMFFCETEHCQKKLFFFQDWASLATHCSRSPVEGYPFANVFSISDGPTLEQSSGTPYFYLTPLELSVQDLKVDIAQPACLTELFTSLKSPKSPIKGFYF